MFYVCLRAFKNGIVWNQRQVYVGRQILRCSDQIYIIGLRFAVSFLAKVLLHRLVRPVVDSASWCKHAKVGNGCHW